MKALGVEMRYIFTILFITFASISSAEPSTHVQTLMDRPLSILDWGLFKLESRLQERGIDATVSYLWNDDKILIKTHDNDKNKKDHTMEQTQSECVKVFNSIDDVLLIENGDNVIGALCMVCAFFGHNGWTSKSLNTASENIKDRVYYQSYHWTNWCERKAYGKSVSVGSY